MLRHERGPHLHRGRQARSAAREVIAMRLTSLGMMIVAITAPFALGQGGRGRGPVDPLLNGNPYVSPQEVKGGAFTRLPDGKPDLQGAWLQRTIGNSMSMYSIEKTDGHPKTNIPR